MSSQLLLPVILATRKKKPHLKKIWKKALLMVVRKESYITMVYYRAIDVCGQTLFGDDVDQDGKIDMSNWHSNVIKNPSSLKIMNLPYLRYETDNFLDTLSSQCCWMHRNQKEGMQLDQLIQNTSYSRDTIVQIQPFERDILRESFQLRETAPIELPLVEKGIPTVVGKSKSEFKDKERKHKKHKDRDMDKDKEHKRHKHRHKERSKDKDKEKKKDRSGHHDSSADLSKKHHERLATSLITTLSSGALGKL
ncbi:hypothetical protein FH972_010612 [Carpinus fangiana]|uniref:EF-hand domain-containing protein n=1 Tax=Carpinus fangiana TaxID=176857 RepID=A0A660KVT5_9ROSI|nr:hypothetical protein FH972_010612 [Carpinus fangiana]